MSKPTSEIKTALNLRIYCTCCAEIKVCASALAAISSVWQSTAWLWSEGAAQLSESAFDLWKFTCSWVKKQSEIEYSTGLSVPKLQALKEKNEISLIFQRYDFSVYLHFSPHLYSLCPAQLTKSLDATFHHLAPEAGQLQTVQTHLSLATCTRHNETIYFCQMSSFNY